MTSESLVTIDESAALDIFTHTKKNEQPEAASSVQHLVASYNSHEELVAAISEYEENTKSNFVSFERTKNFANTDFWPHSKSRIHWQSLFQDETEWSGIPYVIVGRRVLICHLGKDLSISKKIKYEKEKKIKEVQDHTFQKGRLLIQNTKKLNCQCKIFTYHLLSFPEFKITSNTEKKKKLASLKIKKELQKDTKSITAQHSYAVKFPKISEHENHATSGEIANIREKVDKRVKEKIVDLYREGFRTVSEIKKHADIFVKQELVQVSETAEQSRRRFYPTRKDIANLIGKSRQEGRNSLLDQENIIKMISKWQQESPKDNFYCRLHKSKSEDQDKQKFLFCYQSEWQKRMLEMYGSITLLDATYRTSRYALPLFFLCVRTNVCYSVVGTFVTQEETSNSIEEALFIFKEWNPKWKPDTWMVDFCLEEIKAISNVFQETHVTLCDFHREKAWTEWVRKKEHGVSHKQSPILNMLRKIAHAHTMREHNEALNTLMESDPWKKCELFRQWFSAKWLPAIKMWAHVFRIQSVNIVINTNNGLERQHETLKHSYLHGYRNCTLSELFDVLYSRFFPDGYKKYVQLNVQGSEMYRKYKQELPAFLKNRPREFVMHMIKRWFSDLDEDSINCLNMETGIFLVQSESSQETKYHVNLGSDCPSCTCADWRKLWLPCKHMCVVIRCIALWKWEKLHPSYTENPLFCLDKECYVLNSEGTQTEQVLKFNKNLFVLPTEKTATLPPRRRTELTNLTKRCVQILKKTMDCVYLIKDKNVLSEFIGDCTQNYEKALSVLPMDHGIPLIEPSKNTTSKTDNINPLPIRRYGKRKQAGAQRFGEKAEKLKCEVLLDSAQHDVERGSVIMVSQTESWLTINDIKLTKHDKEQIRSGAWLDDNVINVCQYLISLSHCNYAGLMDTLIVAHNLANAVESEQVLQIHHIGAHWVTSQRHQNKITVYDSLPFSGVPDPLKKQIINMYSPLFTGTDKALDINFLCCQKQAGSNDCGLFAIANCTALAKSFNVAKIRFEQDEMRPHLIKCLEKMNMEMFPHKPCKSRPKVHKVKMTLYCSCNLHFQDEDMIQCDQCKLWLHFHCAGVQKNDKRVTSNQKFFCALCTK